ncbi:hypothetical protein COCMIDRAFT_27966 [Bipolaris oryzae ATCC 44560]|uniref:Uncharacterized protein n=1 Tax=Bipolaris oryzae ATCC 44560 TaxID=930090 RepID=W6Z1I0_COCMI|nr:uncharacterized protein COCMIDRAFT_27966 [Bipolaris oryzae ATCC 44560]EUC43568.1 hypothetical protein COCMIDRAFT_27966 [Bipolaris oryzae ATCC 44560]
MLREWRDDFTLASRYARLWLPSKSSIQGGLNVSDKGTLLGYASDRRCTRYKVYIDGKEVGITKACPFSMNCLGDISERSAYITLRKGRYDVVIGYNMTEVPCHPFGDQNIVIRLYKQCEKEKNQAVESRHQVSIM